MSDRRRSPLVRLAPRWRKSNPFLDLLAAGLREAGYRTGFTSRDPTLFLIQSLTLRADVVHVHWVEPYSRSWLGVALFTAGLVAHRLLGRRIVWTIHNLRPHEARAASRARAVSCAMRALAHRFVTMSESAAELAADSHRVPRERTSVIPHGHYIDRYGAPAPAASSRASIGFAPEDFVSGFVGQIRPYKGLDDLLTLHKRGGLGDSKLLVAGRPNTRRFARDLLALASPDVVFDLRFLPDDDLKRAVAACDVLVFPYRDILNSGSIVMAMSLAKPFVAPRLGSLIELDGAPYYFSYDPTDPTGLEQAIQRARSQKPNLPNLGRDALKSVQSQNWTTITQQHIQVYQGP